MEEFGYDAPGSPASDHLSDRRSPHRRARRPAAERLAGARSYIRDINLRHTTIRELANNLVVVPNAKLAAAVNRNYSLPEQEVTVLVDVGVRYANDLAKVERVTLDVARETLCEVWGGVPDFEPQVRYHSFADPGVRFTAVLRARAFVDQFLLKHEFIKRLHRRYGDEGIEVA